MLRGRITLGLITAGSLAVVGGIRWYYLRERDAIEAGTTRELAAVAEFKVSQIATWRRERLGDGRMLQCPETTRIARRILGSRNAAAADVSDLQAVMRLLETDFQYPCASLLDRDGNARVTFPAGGTLPSRFREFAKRAAAEQTVTLEDLYLDPDVHRPLMALTIPMEGLGAMVLEIDPDRFLYPYLATWPGSSASAETTLEEREPDHTLFLSNMRHEPGIAMVTRRPIEGAAAHLGNEYFEHGYLDRIDDYRGTPVLRVIQRVPDSKWFLLAKMDVAEADAPLRRLGWELALLAMLIALTNVVVARSIWKAEELEQRKRHEQEVRLLSARLLTAHEEERAHIARELHDDLSQQIAALSIAIGNLKRQIARDPAEAAALSDRMQQRFVDLAESLRRMSHELHPAVLEHSGLASALRAYSEEFSVLTGIHAKLTVKGTCDNLPRAVAWALYRIAQEALQNVAKHSGAREASLVLEHSDGIVHLAISDKGAGMRPDRNRAEPGLGLISIRERTLALKGTVEILSKPGQGTTVSVKVPV